MKKAVFVFCMDLKRDPVASHVFEALEKTHDLIETDLEIDGYTVLEAKSDGDHLIRFVRTSEVISHDYGRYADPINEHFGSYDFVGLVNWHQGANAPNAIFTVQTTGDMGTGTFSPVDPKITRSLMLVIEQERQAAGLTQFQTYAEATHWSGVLYDTSGEAVANIKPSIIDVEIGSSPDDWANPVAAEVLARSISRCFDEYEETAKSLLCIGGVHFERGFSQVVFSEAQSKALAVSHILPNHWLVSEGYDAPERLGDLRACANSISGGVDAVVFHDKLKSVYKQLARQLAEELDVPSFSHKKLKSPEALPI